MTEECRTLHGAAHPPGICQHTPQLVALEKVARSELGAMQFELLTCRDAGADRRSAESGRLVISCIMGHKLAAVARQASPRLGEASEAASGTAPHPQAPTLQQGRDQGTGGASTSGALVPYSLLGDEDVPVSFLGGAFATPWPGGSFCSEWLPVPMRRAIAACFMCLHSVL